VLVREQVQAERQHGDDQQGRHRDRDALDVKQDERDDGQREDRDGMSVEGQFVHPAGYRKKNPACAGFVRPLQGTQFLVVFFCFLVPVGLGSSARAPCAPFLFRFHPLRTRPLSIWLHGRADTGRDGLGRNEAMTVAPLHKSH